MSAFTVLTAAAALLATVLLAVLAGRAARATGLGRSGTGERLRVEESLALDARRRLLLIRCEGRLVLLLTGPQDRVVGWIDEPRGAP